MSKVKAGGSVNQHSQGARKGRRLGIKKSGGQKVMAGHIIVRQRGAKYKPGKGVKMGHDHTIMAMQAGVVSFGQRHGKTVISVAA